MRLPPLPADGILRLQLHVPLDAVSRPPNMAVWWNGKEIEQGVCAAADFERRYVLPSRSGAPNELRIVLDEAGHAPGDPREFALELFAISWERMDGVGYGL